MNIDVEHVTISGSRSAITRPDNNGNITLNAAQLYELPHFAGAVDAMKVLQFTPGVIAAADGDASIYVRGSDPGQNITLLNNAPVYSPSHLFGFFSVFNSAHLGGLSFLKSNIPAMYGSALSSVTDVRTRLTVPSQLSLEGNLGIIEADLAAALPLGKSDGLYLSARHSYTTWMASAIINQPDFGVNYEFGDFGLTYVHKFSKIGTLVVNSHLNRDNARLNLSIYDSHGKVGWWDSTTSAVLTSDISSTVRNESTLYATLYKNNVDLSITQHKVAAPSAVGDFGVRNNTTFSLDGATIDAGIDYAFRRVTPQTFSSSLTQDVTPAAVQHTHEGAMYASVRYQPFRHLELDAGLRLSLYGIGSEVEFHAEPRLLVAVPLSHRTRLWACYNKATQYLQFVPISNIGFATDYYLSSTSQNPPQVSHSFSLGYSQSALSNSLHWSAELFYRQLFNCLEYDARLTTMLSPNYDIEKYLYSGNGEAYGIELMVGYLSPRFDLQANYTLSRSLRSFAQINHGKAFAAKSDRRHNLSLMATYRPSERWTLSSTFVFASGAPYTAPTAIYSVGGAFMKEFGPYNGSRLPNYHHLDLSATYWFKSERFQRSGLNISLYNIYFHKNPIIISWAVFEDYHIDQTYHIRPRHHALYTFIPSVSWTFKF